MSTAQRLRVAHLTFDMAIGGAEQVICQLVRGLGARCESSVLCLDAPLGALGEQLAGEGVAVRSFERRPGFDSRLLRALRRWLLDVRPQVLHCHQYTPWFYGWLASRGLGIRLVFTEHGRHHPDVRRPKRALVNPLMAATTRSLVAISRATRDALVTNEYLPGRRIEVIYNGVQGFERDDADAASLRASLAIAPDAIVFGTVSRLDPIKNQRMLIEAFADVAASREDVHLLVVGDGPLGDTLRAQAATTACAERIHFPGFRTDANRFLALMDGYLLPSLSEGTSMTLLEAMSLCLPCIVTDVGGNPEIVEDDVTGIVTPDRDRVALGAAMRRLADDESERQRLGRAARERFDARFSLSQMVDGYARLYGLG